MFRRTQVRAISIALAALLGVIVTGCAPDIVFVSDEYFAELLVDHEFRRDADALAQSADRRLSIMVVDEQSVGRLAQGSRLADCYLFSPILRDIGVDFADKSQAAVFVFGVDPTAGTDGRIPANVVAVSFDRSQAFYDAGAQIAQLTSRDDGPGLSVGAIVDTSEPSREAEYRAFVDGFSSVDESRDIRARRFPRRPRREELRTAVRDMITRGVQVTLVAMGDQNPFVMDLLAGQPISIVTEDISDLGAYADQIILSIDRSVPAVLSEVVARCGDPDLTEVRVEATVSRGAQTQDLSENFDGSE